MRIIAGKKKGLVLQSVVPSHVRPTSDRAREALFMLLTQGAWSAHWQEGIRFVDMCAGVGSVGIEAWSRGAHATFVEKEQKAFKSLCENVKRLQDPEHLAPYKGDIFALPKARHAYDIVFIDAPYDLDIHYASTLDHWHAQGWLVRDARLVLQLDRGFCQKSMEEIVHRGFWSTFEIRQYGRNQFVSGTIL